MTEAYMDGRLKHRGYWRLLYVASAAVGLLAACTLPSSTATRIETVTPTASTFRPAQPSLPAAPRRLVQPTAVIGPTATAVRPTESALRAVSATPNPFAILTALALTPTQPPIRPTPPTRLTIPSIALDVVVYPVTTDAHGNAVVLKHDVAWYERSGKPAEGTNIVFWAHVLRWKDSPDIPAPFARVHELRPGDRLTITTNAGRRFDYVVTFQLRVNPNRVDYLQPTPLEQLTLISCIGDTIIANGELTETERLVTIALPVVRQR